LEELKSYRQQLESELGDALSPLVEEGAAGTDDEAVRSFVEWADR